MVKLFLIAATIAINIALACSADVDVITDGDTGKEAKPKRDFLQILGLGGYPGGSPTFGAYPGGTPAVGAYPGAGYGGAYQQYQQQQQFGYGVRQGGYPQGVGGYEVQAPLYSNALGYGSYPGLGYGGLGFGGAYPPNVGFRGGPGGIGIGQRGVGYGGYLQR